MLKLTRTQTLYFADFEEYIQRLQQGERKYLPPPPNMEVSTPFQNVINACRLKVPSVHGACGYGQALTYYALLPFGIIYLHQMADLYLSIASHAFLVIDIEKKLLLVDLTFGQFTDNLLVSRSEAVIYDHLHLNGWIELTSEVIPAYCYAVLGKRSSSPLPSLEAFRTSTALSPDFSLEELKTFNL